MNIKDFKSVTASIPFQYTLNNEPKVALAEVEVDREGDIVIRIPGIKHANHFIDMFLTQQILGLVTVQQEPQSGIPGHNIEVTTEPSEQNFTNEELCIKHIPIQQRDGKEPWCRRCGLNKDYEPARTISFSNRPSAELRENLREFEGRRREGT